MRILLIDDNPTSLALLTHILKKYAAAQISVYTHPLEAIQVAQRTEFDIVLVDYQMPELDGISVIRHLRSIGHMRLVPMVMITGDSDRTIKIEALEAGANDFLTKPIEPVELRARVSNLMLLRKAQVELGERVSEREHEMLRRLILAVESRDGSTGDHVQRMAEVCRLIARGLGLDQDAVDAIYTAAPLHDIGKIGISDAILNKPGKLTDEEMQIMRTHVTIGEHIINGSTSKSLRAAAEITAAHHERWDGTGYPRRLAGKGIPLSGRIAAIADVFDALTSDRPYKKAWSLEDAKAHVIKEAGHAFDPACVESFCSQWDAIERLYSPGRKDAAPSAAAA